MLEVNRFRVWAVMVAAALATGILVLAALVEPAEAAFPGANGRIAFVSDRTTGADLINNPTADAEIFTMNPNGTNVLQATFNTAEDREPAWRADGQKIAFSSDTDGDSEVYIMDPNGAQQEQLTSSNTTSDSDPTWSPDGTKIAFTKDVNSEIYVMDSDPDTDDTPANLTLTTAREGKPAWSPNRDKIAFASDQNGDSDIFVMNQDGSKQRNRTNNASPVDDRHPDWQPVP